MYYESPERKRNNLYRTMGDCQIVLRFFALREDSAVRGSMRSILDRCMERNLQMTVEERNLKYQEYVDRLTLADMLFDGRPFLLEQKQGARPSESMYDAVMISADKLWGERDALLKVKESIQRMYWSVLDTAEKIEQFSGRANTASDVKLRISAMTELFEAALQNG